MDLFELWLYISMSIVISKDPNIKSEFVNFARFWKFFAEFLNAIEKSFSHYQSIFLDILLKEDFELNRFLVLKNHISVNKNALADQRSYLKS